MSVSKDPDCGTFYVQCRYKDWTGESKKKTKRGFKTEKEARKWEFEFLKRMEGASAMLFSKMVHRTRKMADEDIMNTIPAQVESPGARTVSGC